MPRRNDIAKILIIGAGPIAKTSALVLLLGSCLCACELTRTEQKVSSDFAIAVVLRGQPLANSKVIIRRNETDAQIVREARTNRKGRVRIQKLPPGRYVIISSEWPPNTWWKEVLVDPLGGAHEVTLEIPRPRTIRLAAIAGVVLGPGGATLAGAKVAIEKPGRHGNTTAASAQTDATGSFMAALAQRGDYILRVSSPGLHSAIIPIHFDKGDSIAWPRFRLTMKPVVSECGERWNPYAYEISKSEQGNYNEARPMTIPERPMH